MSGGVRQNAIAGYAPSKSTQIFRIQSSTEKAKIVIITALDDRGFFTGSIHAVAKKAGLDADGAKQILDEIKTLDPPGIGAKNHKESIEIQLRAHGLLTDGTTHIVRQHLDNLSKENFTAIMRVSNVDEGASKKLLVQNLICLLFTHS